jgi:hypothetical protein
MEVDMRYLLVGNGALLETDYDLIERAKVIIQINDCRHADKIPYHLTKYVFLSNTGTNQCEKVVDAFLEKQHLFSEVQIILARNPIFYRLKKLALAIKRRPHGKHCTPSNAWNRLANSPAIKKTSFLSSLRLDLKMIRMGMAPSYHPSTGMIAYDWLSRYLSINDRLDIIGFSFEGWSGHAWSVEKQIIKDIEEPILTMPGRTLNPWEKLHGG